MLLFRSQLPLMKQQRWRMLINFLKFSRLENLYGVFHVEVLFQVVAISLAD